MLRLAEQPHIVIQGEGPNIGKKMIVLRTYGCPIQCQSCDSTQTWELPQNSGFNYKVEDLANEIFSMIENFDVKWLMITGGEPAIQIKELKNLLSYIEDFDPEISIDFETTGYFDIELLLDYNINFNISPKFLSLLPKDDFDKNLTFDNSLRNNLALLYGVQKPFSIKLVVSKDTLQYVEEVIEEYSMGRKEVYLMPFGTTRKEILNSSESIIEYCLNENLNFSPRLHVLIFDDKKLV
jgi:organic radical activating enzyme